MTKGAPCEGCRPQASWGARRSTRAFRSVSCAEASCSDSHYPPRLHLAHPSRARMATPNCCHELSCTVSVKSWPLPPRLDT
eukprot:3823278-Rhodomonas_salina.1